MIVALAGCQAVAPALTSLLMAFGQDMLAATAVNYTPRYAIEVENLLAVLARHATGLEFQGQLAQAGYRPPQPEYLRQDQAGVYGQYDQDPGYGQYGQTPAASQGAGYGQYEQGAYGQSSESSAYDAYGDGYQSADDGYTGQAYPPNDGYGSGGSDGQGETTTSTGAGDAYGYGYGQAGYGGGYTPEPAGSYQDPYAMAAGRTRSADAAPVSLGVALLVRRAGTTELVAVADGDTLQDGRGDPSRGDLLRFHFQANCACWVYVVGIDATGYVAQIFPDPDGGGGNPVRPGTNYLVPGGDDWWGLDDQRGIEQVYFLAARQARPDVEAAIARLAAAPRQLATDNYRPVAEPAILPSTRGLVKVEAPAPVQVPLSERTSATVRPAIFTNNDPATDLVVTRWFRHE